MIKPELRLRNRGETWALEVCDGASKYQDWWALNVLDSEPAKITVAKTQEDAERAMDVARIFYTESLRKMIERRG